MIVLSKGFVSIKNFLLRKFQSLVLDSKVVSAQAVQNKCQENRNQNLAAKIVEEMEDNEDDVFFASGSGSGTGFELPDVNASVPGMALSFMSWALEELDFEYLFLTEDSSFVAVDKVGLKLTRNCSSDISSFTLAYR